MKQILHANILASLSLAASFALGLNAYAAEWRHAAALNGTPKYAEGFAHFDYVRPDAPKGGKVVQGAIGGFDSLNPIIPKGETAPGISALSSNFIYQTLFTPSMDEADISAEYGLIAEAIKYPDDFSSVSFRLNVNAKWHDGTPISVEDVIWSFEKQIELHPNIAAYYSSVEGVSKSAEREVTFTFKEKNNRELPKILAGLTILPKHWWTGTNEKGEARDISKTTLEAPLGSGPYKIGNFEPSRFIEFERVPEAWAAELNVNIGKNNFDVLRYDMYKDATVLVEAFRAGDTDWRFENSASNWVKRYNGPARDRGEYILETKADTKTGVMQGYVLNLRNDALKDRKVRQALELTFDFGTMNKTVLSNLYFQPNSYFSGTQLAATNGPPSEGELKYLNPLRDQLPEEVFTQRYKVPETGSETAMRKNYKRALELFAEAGWTLNKQRKLVNEEGEQLKLRYADYSSPLNEKTVLPLKASMAKIGIELEYLPTDIPTFINKRRTFDYDMMVAAWGQSLSPGNEQRGYWGSKAAGQEGSRNYAGIDDPAIDALIENVIFAPNREELVHATRALDRALLAGHYVIPQFFYPFERYARWDIFGKPASLPEYSVGFPDIWWFDEQKAAKLNR